jgi:hypothetical protein
VSVRLRTELAQLSIVAGTQQEKASNVGVVERSAIVPVGAGKGNLYLLVEVTGDPIGKEAIYRELVDILSKEYLRVPGGITNGLRQAVRAANGLLYRKNLHSFPDDRRIGEASCAVLRGNDLYMCLTGVGLFYVVQGERLRFFPPTPSRHLTSLVEEERPTLSPLGVKEYLQEPGLFHCHIGADDIILLASSALPRLASRQQLMEAAQGGLVEMTHTLISLASASDLSTLLIRTEAEEREDVVRREMLVARGRTIASGVKRVPVGQVATGVKKIPSRRIASGLGRMIATVGTLILAIFGGLASGVRGFFSWLASSGIFENLGRGVRAAFVSLLRGSGTMARRMLPEPEAVPRPMEVAHARRARVVSARKSGRLLPIIGVLSIVCAIALVAASLVLYNRARVAQFSQLLEEAQAERHLALGSSAPADIRQHLGKAEELVERALRIRSADPEAMALLDELIVALDGVNQVVRLEFAAHVPFTGPENQPRRALLHNRDVYILDRGTRELYGYFLDEQGGFQEPAGGAVLLGQEAIPGAAAIQELDDFIWMEAGNGRLASNLLVLVNRRSLLQFDGLRGFAPVSVADSQLWSEPRLIGGYFGFLYILDAAADRILKYAPTGDTYDSPPTDYFQPEISVELGNTVDMAIDGHIYVLLADGDILRFAGGQQEPFSVSGLLDHELQNPTAIFTSPEVEYVYVADAGNERVVQLDKEGGFVRQFRPARASEEAVQNLQDVFVNETGGELLVLSSEGLFLALIPEAPQVE